MDDITSTYAPFDGETGSEYGARLAAIKNPNPLALRAAGLIAAAMSAGLYDPASPDKSGIEKALEHIACALETFGVTRQLAGVGDRLMAVAVAEVRKKIQGIDIDISRAKQMIAGKASKDMGAELSKAVNLAWQEIKDGAGFGDPNINGRKVVKSFKEEENGHLVDTDLSRLAEGIFRLRELYRDDKKRS